MPCSVTRVPPPALNFEGFTNSTEFIVCNNVALPSARNRTPLHSTFNLALSAELDIHSCSSQIKSFEDTTVASTVAETLLFDSAVNEQVHERDSSNPYPDTFTEVPSVLGTTCG